MKRRSLYTRVALSYILLLIGIPAAEAFLLPAANDGSFAVSQRWKGLKSTAESTSPDSHAYIFQDRTELPPPPCPKSNPADDVFRTIRRSWPVPVQNWLQESGILRAIQDALIYVGIPSLARVYPQAVSDFFHLSFSGVAGNSAQCTARNVRLTKLSYGDHPSQIIDLLEPQSCESPPDGVVAFVHGGAWGSGQPWMYRLVALPFLAQNFAVAVIGYRTYPDADVNGQVADVGCSLEVLAQERPDLMCEGEGIEALIGHSSGSHISMLHVLEMTKQRLKGECGMTPIKNFIGISGVYCITSHYDYEKGRGVDQLSALRVACGPDERFRDASPGYRLQCMVESNGEEDCVLMDENGTPIVLDDHLPQLLLVHGVDDNVVQYTQSCNVVDSIRSVLAAPDKCEEIILESIGHAETVLHLMVGGKTRDAVTGWLEARGSSCI